MNACICVHIQIDVCMHACMHACIYATAEFTGFRSLENREANISANKSIGV